MPFPSLVLAQPFLRPPPPAPSVGPPNNAILDNLNSGGAGVNAEIQDDKGSGGAAGNDITDP